MEKVLDRISESCDNESSTGETDMLTIIAIATVIVILFTLTMAVVKGRAELAAHAMEQASKHIPQPTPYVGPVYNDHGREVSAKKR